MNTMLIRIALLVGLILVPFLGWSGYSENHPKNAEKRALQISMTLPSLQARTSVTTPEKSTDPMVWGCQAYHYSCVACHGIEPQGLVHHDAKQFQ